MVQAIKDGVSAVSMHNVVARSERYQAAILMETFLWTFTFEDDFEPKFRMPFRMMRGPLGFFFVQVLNMMTKKVIPEHCPITDEGLQTELDDMRALVARDLGDALMEKRRSSTSSWRRGLIRSSPI